jgi:GT2 family glycosyltransferase
VGRHNSRKAGLTSAKGEIVVNIDSDVVINPDTLEKIANYFETNKDINALTGLLSTDHPNENYFSQYKNLYMNYIFSRLPDRVSFIYGSIFAIRKKLVKHYQSAATITDDTEFGQQLAAEGEKIAFLKDLTVVHLKNMTFFSWVKNDFLIPNQWAIIFLQKKGWRQLGKNNVGFGHAPKEQLISVMLVPSLLLLAVASAFLPMPGAVFGLLLAIWFILNLRFFLFLTRERGVVFGISKAVPVTLLDHFIMASGIISGLIAGLLKPRKQGP